MLFRLVATWLLLTLFIPLLHASHLMGGEFTYRQIDSNQYVVTLKLYRDTRGIQAATTAYINVNPLGSGQSNYTVALPKVSVDTISPACAPFSVELHTYGDTVIVNTDFFTLSYTECCRNAAITNLSTPTDMLLYAQRNQIAQVSNPVNNGPVMNSPATLFVPVGQPVLLDFGAVDPDGDSLTYAIGSPMNGQFQPIPMNAGYAPVYGTSTIDPSTGELIVEGFIPQVSVIRVDIKEYRNTPQGAEWIGQTFRDIQVHFIASNNQLPVITGMDSTQNDIVSVHPGDTVAFDVYATDPDPLDTLVWQWQQDIPNATITVTGGARPVLSFFWVPDSSDIQFAPHIQHLSVTDNNCLQVGTGARLFSIYVVPDTAQEVWPGDTDYDGVAMIFDVLPIGLAYGESGPTRPNASTGWTGQAAPNWPSQFFSGLNHKHSDANGDGVIDSLDVDVVFLNYGQVHQKKGAIQGSDIQVYFEQGTLVPGGTGVVWVEATTPIADYFGMAMELLFTPGLAVPGSFVWEPVAGTGGQAFGTMVELNGGIGLALATFDYSITNRVASTLGRITFTVAPGRQAGESVEVIVLASKLVDAQGVELPLQPGGSVATINAASGAMSASPSVFMYPNPATNHVKLSWMHPVERIHVLDVQGRQVGSWQLSGTLSYSLSTMDWLPGMYLIVWEGHKQSGSTMLMVHH